MGTTHNMKKATVAFVIGFLLSLLSSSQAVISGVVATSTVNQNGSKFDYNAGMGSASKIGTFDFDIANPLSMVYLKARIRLWAQLPPEAVGDLAPAIVFAKVGTTNLEQALIAGDAVRTDLRISFNLFESGLGVVQKQTDFEKLTKLQGLALASIIASDASTRLEAWLVSDTLKAITVPAVGEKLELVNGFPVVTFTPFTSTLDLEYVPEPSSSVIIGSLGVLALRIWRSRAKRIDTGKEGFAEPCSV